MSASPPISTDDLAATPRQDAASQERAAALSKPRLQPPARVAGYEVIRCLGEGAYGSVWLAAERNTGKQVAVKFYSHRRGIDWSLLNREVEKLAVLYTSRETIGLLSVGWDADPPYYVMEYLAHGSLAKLLEQGPLPVPEAVRIVTGVTQALVHAHRHNILHCDLKPANVLLDAENGPRLADFGQSRLSHEQSPALGTLFYMAPEQADLTAIPDPCWDVYALGALLYHTLCGEAPYRSPENEARIREAGKLEERLTVYRQIIAAGPRPTKHRSQKGVDSRLADIVDRCLDPDPRRRFPDARAVLDAFESRKRHRARRPLMVLSVVGPVLLLLSLMPIAAHEMNVAARTAETNLAARALESDVVTAKILSVALAKGLEYRRHQLQEIAGDEQLRRAAAAAAGKPRGSPEREQLERVLSQLKSNADADLEEQQIPLDDSWFYTDAHGFQRWRGPPSDETLDDNFAHRDYFHGRGHDFPSADTRLTLRPITKPHISGAYRGTTGGKYKVAISVPIFSVPAAAPADEAVIGVLSRTILLGQLLAGYHDLIRADNVDRTIALVDLKTGKLLDHPWMTDEHLLHLPATSFERLSLSEEQTAALEQLTALVRAGESPNGEERSLAYADPVGSLREKNSEAFTGDWLAAFWPVENTNWAAIVQERRGEALRPVHDIQNGLIRYLLGGLFLCGGLVAALWYVVLRAVTDRVTFNN